MSINLVTFASQEYRQSADILRDSAWRHGVNGVMLRTPEQFALSNIYRENQALFSQPRGCGYWAWKPLAILSAMSYDDDVLIYADAGVEFIGNVQEIISRMDQDIFLFGNNWEHAHWCKADVMAELGPWGWFGKQVQASVIFFRVTDYTRHFVGEWLDWCLFEGGRLIDDSPSRTPNHPEFREHRHDQAILTTMAYRDGLKLHWWPASYNDGAFIYEKLPQYAADDYSVLFNHHRKRNHEWAKCA